MGPIYAGSKTNGLIPIDVSCSPYEDYRNIKKEKTGLVNKVLFT